MRSVLKKGMMIVSVFAMLMAGCGQQEQGNLEGTVATENTDSTTAKGSKVFADATVIELSDEVITVDGNVISADEENSVYVANDIVFYLEGQDFTYGEGEESDAHSQEEADKHTVVHITKPGTYAISGTLSAGQIAVDLGEDAKENPEAVVTLILNGVDINCSVAPAVIFYDVYECGVADEETATNTVDTTAAGANVLIADGSVNNVCGAYVARIYKADSVELSEDGTEVVDAKKLHKYDAAFYSKMSMNINGDKEGTGILNITAVNEGLDSELHLTINGGNINITSGNDGINTNEDYISVTTVNGGTLKIKVTGETGEGDGIDSNGWLVINGGTVISEACSTSGDAGIDSDMGIHINGGAVMATGNMLDHISESIQNYAVFQFASSQKAGATYTLKNEAGEVVLECTPENAFTYLIFASDNMTAGTYTMWQGENQLAASAGNMMGGFGGGMMGGFKGGQKPEDGQMPDNMEIQEGGEMSEGMVRPEGGFDGEASEGMEFPENGQIPEGMEMPADGQMPEETEMQEGMQRTEGGRGGKGGFGGMENMGNAEVSTEFVIEDGGSYFNNVKIAE